MRTTLEIDDDVLQAAKELAAKQSSTAGQVISSLARKALNLSSNPAAQSRSGVPVLPSRGEVISLEHVRKLMDREGV
jgi:hypothetical protein